MDTDNKIDQKISNILKELDEAHKRSEKYYGKRLVPGEEIVPHDFFEMALAFDNEERLLVQFELALAEKYSDHYSNQAIEYLKRKLQRLNRRVRCWQNRQYPGART